VTERIIRACFGKPFLALLLVGAAVVLGAIAFQGLQRDVFPDLSAPVFNVIVQNPAMGAEELETGIAIPLESALAGLPDVRRIRSASQLGVAQVTVEFLPQADYYRSRQLVAERVGQAASELPPGTDAPLVSSLTGRLITGWLLDRFDAARISMLLLSIAALGTFLLAGAHSLAAGVLAAICLGFGAGGEVDVTPYLLSRHFGLRSLSTLYGLNWTAWGLASAVGAVILGRSYDVTGSYMPALIVLGCLTLGAAGLMWTLPPVPQRIARELVDQRT